ncbi:UBN2 domain-containing protein, partial [Cephalotus follicularis]
DLLGFINGKTPQLAQEIESAGGAKVTNPYFTSWVHTDRLAKAWIMSTLSEEVFGQAIGMNTSFELWEALTVALSQATEAHEFDLLSQLQFLKISNTTTLSDYLNKFKAICDQLDAICKPKPNQRKVFSLLTNLGSDYEAFSKAMLKPPVPCYLDLIPLLQNHELRHKQNQPDHTN